MREGGGDWCEGRGRGGRREGIGVREGGGD